MSVAALSHGYPPFWNMGGEVSLHRSLRVLSEPVTVFTKTDSEYQLEGVNVKPIALSDVLNPRITPTPLIAQFKSYDFRVVIAQNELSLPAVRVAAHSGAISVVSVHTPPKYGRTIKEGMRFSDYAVYNTHAAAKGWGEPEAFVLHPPISAMPDKLNPEGDAYTLLSSLRNKGVTVVLELARRFPNKRFIIVRSPAEDTHGIKDIEEQVAALPNVELHPRVDPDEVYKYLKQTRILLVPSMYETYGMSAIEAAGYGIPSIHVDTPHVREGIGKAAFLISPLSVDEAEAGIIQIEQAYLQYSSWARARAEEIAARQVKELKNFNDYISSLEKPVVNLARRKAIARASARR